MKAEKETAKEKPMTARYHISRRENGQYAATLEGAGRASILCPTQSEAIEYARNFSENKSDGGVVLVHAERNTENYSAGQIRASM